MTHPLTYSFYFGSNSAGQFAGAFEELYRQEGIRRRYLLKGGPGCGKSSLMKRMAERLQQRGCPVEKIFCSSDPASLDAILSPAAAVAMVDATAPHVMEPVCPGGVDVYLDFGAFWDLTGLARERESIEKLSGEIAGEFAAAFRHLSGAKSQSDEIFNRVLPLADRAKLARRAQGILRRDIPRTKGRPPGRKRTRFLSAITPYGVYPWEDTPGQLADRVTVLSDRYGLAPFVMEPICQAALENGYDVYAAYCPLNPAKLEHVIVPALSRAWVTEHDAVRFGQYQGRRVHLESYVDAQALRPLRRRLRAGEKLKGQMRDQAVECLGRAKALHDKLEECFVPHMDFAGVDALFDRLVADIERL